MVTVVDPNGTPAPVYTRSGTTIQTINASGTTSIGSTLIIAPSGWSVVIVTVNVDPDDRAVRLPQSAPIGDVVEVYATGSGSTASVFPFSGDSIEGVSPPLTVPLGGSGALLRKTDATIWRVIKGVGL